MYFNDYNKWDDQFIAPSEATPAAEPVKAKKAHGTGKLIALCLVCALLGGTVGAAGMGAAGLLTGFGRSSTTISVSDRAPTVVNTVRVDGQTAMSVDQVYAANLGSVVGVNGDVKTNYWGQVVSNPVAGSGFVITSDGYILTNYHVIDGVEDLKVSFADGTTYDATLVGGEEANDIAVLKIDATGLQTVVVGNSDDMKVGQQVVAIGNPLGELTFTLTAGYVSALDRNITMSDGNTINVMQTDAAINSGNSGGPLFNTYGECIGITNAKYSNNGSTNASIEGIGFAIPINDVIDMVSDIIEKGYVTGKPNVGVLMEEVSNEAIQRYGIPDGAYISAVLDGSCADKAGIKEGDIITAVDGEAITSADELREAVKAHKAGDRVKFTLWRDNETLTVTATLDEYDQARSEAMDKLQKSYQEAQQPSTQQRPSTGSNGFSTWPFGNFWW